MRSNEERVAAVKRRVEQLEARRRRVRSRVAAVSSVAACLALIVCLSFAMPGIMGRLAEWSYGAYGAAASIFTGSSTLGYIIIGLLAFVLGIFVTILCFKLRSLGGRDGDDNGRDN